MGRRTRTEAEGPTTRPFLAVVVATIGLLALEAPAASAQQSVRLYTANADGTARARLSISAPASNPSWSPDGRRIAFLGFGPAASQLYVSGPDGSAPAQVTRSAEDDKTGAVWSPDSTKLAFVEGNLPDARLMVMNADGTDPRALAAVNEDFPLPSWSPDGTRLAFLQGESDRSRLSVVNAAGGGLKTLAKVQIDNNEGGLPKWSPDGSRIAFVSVRRGGFAVHVIGSDGSGLRALSNRRCILDAAWSPDGRRLACVGVLVAPRGRVYEAINVIKLDGSLVRTVARARLPKEVHTPAWSPDGRKLSYVQSGGGDDTTVSLRTAGVDGRALHVLTRRAPLNSPASWAPDSRRLVFSAVTG